MCIRDRAALARVEEVVEAHRARILLALATVVLPVSYTHLRERFEREDHGGVIYELPSDTFVHEIRGGAKDEWTSRVSVKPTGKTEYKSALEAMLEHGVQVYFVDKSIFVKINNSKDNGMATLRTLDSENSVKNVNIKELPKGDFGE